MKTRRAIAGLILCAGILGACSDTSGPASGDVRVYMARTSTAAVQASAYSTESGSSLFGSIPVTAVDSINVVLTSIEAINATDSTRAVGITLQGAGTQSLNLMKLPSLASDSTQLARGTLTAGTYNNIRLRFSSATITLNQTVTTGQQTYAAGTYELTIPSGLSSGIKVQGASFTVTDDATTSVTLSFDPATTAGNLVATGSNRLMMSPVLHLRTNVDDD